ncbi:MAG: SpoIIE family protein phosphatase [Planctomycetota bacterium]
MEPTPIQTDSSPVFPYATDAASELLAALGADELQRMQDTFAALGQVALGICDPAGKPLTRPSGAAPFCRLLLTTPSGLAACCASVSRAAREQGGEVTEVCHAGMVQYAAPVCVEGRHIATVVLGDRTGAVDRQAVQRLSREHGIAEDALLHAAEQMGPADERRRESVTQFLHLMADRLATICRQHAHMTQRVRELEAVHDLTAMFAGTGHLKGVLTATAQRICKVMEVKACSIRLLDEASGELRIEAGHNLSQAYLHKGPVLLAENPIDRAALAGETVYIRDLPNDPRTRYPDQARAEGLISGLCVPMTYRGKTVGVLRAYTGHEYPFSDFQCALLRSIGSQVAAAILIYRLHQARLSAELDQHQLRNAAAIQRRMMPGDQRTHGNITFGCVYSPALNLGGDFFDFLELPEGNLGFCVADVVGKGLSAALMMASVRAALRAHAHSIYNLDEIVALVNMHMYRDTSISEFATLFYGVFSADGKRLTYCNAGHEPGLLFRGQRVMELTTGGTVIGVFPNTTYSRGLIDLRAGDMLVGYTDGVTDAFDFNDQAFGHARLIDSVRKYAGLDAATLCKQLLWDVRRFVGLAEQTDDITIVVAKVG